MARRSVAIDSAGLRRSARRVSRASPTASRRRARGGSPRPPRARARARRARRGPACSTARAVSRWAIEESTTPLRSASSSASERRLVAGQLAVGVVADERAVGDRAVEAVLGGAHALVEPLRHLLDAVVQRRRTPVCSAAAWATRSSRPASPSTARCAARSRRIRTASTSASTSATSATPPAAERRRARGIASGRPRRDQSLRARRLALREERRVLRLVVVGLLLARAPARP